MRELVGKAESRMSKQIKIFDTTLRDGEQSPGCSMRLSEKIQMARQLERMGVDVIEAGFAIASPGDFESVKAIAETVKNASVASLARALEKDLDRAYEAVKYSEKPRIHTFIATSDIHMEHKLKMAPDALYVKLLKLLSMLRQNVSILSSLLKTGQEVIQNFFHAFSMLLLKLVPQ